MFYINIDIWTELKVKCHLTLHFQRLYKCSQVLKRKLTLMWDGNDWQLTIKYVICVWDSRISKAEMRVGVCTTTIPHMDNKGVKTAMS